MLTKEQKEIKEDIMVKIGYMPTTVKGIKGMITKLKTEQDVYLKLMEINIRMIHLLRDKLEYLKENETEKGGSK